jgi:UDP-N-acetylmuramate dehydrogenase
MQLQHHISLLPYNTFGIEVFAANFAIITTPQHLHQVSQLPQPVRILGGGSNILLTTPIADVVLLNKLTGIEILYQDKDYVWLSVSAGEIWHNLVQHVISKGWGGLENLALIPGTVGAAPIQNIGAYGVEVCSTIESVTYWHLTDKNFVSLTNVECRFGYRDSIFKQDLKGKILITSVVFKLSKHPIFNTSYGAIEEELQQMKALPSVQTIAQAVINIRTSKLPNPQITGNAGSFFKNPTISHTRYTQLLNQHVAIPHYPVGNDMVKIPAAWLIEQCGWKGYRKGDAGVHNKQALVLVNYGAATGNELWQLSSQIVDSVLQKFGIELEREVQVW